MRILIKFASRGRPEQFLRALENIQYTIKTPNYQVIVSADDNDTSMNNDEMRKSISKYRNVKIYYAPQTDKVGAINRDMGKAKPWDLLINFSDDMTWVFKHWDDKIVKSIKSVWGTSLDFFAHFNDNFTNDKLSTMSIMGRKYYKRFDCIYDKSYHSVSCDAEAYWVAQMLNRYHYFPEVYFHHVHPANLRFESDSTYRGNDKWGESDTQNYFNRMKRLFYVKNPDCIPYKLIEEIKTLK